ncbi:MAG TPA: hypothetical protein ENG60_03790 [Thermoplasmatales archaeon]|nr:hypothetical protein [Thermoplasmatales archaeon]HEX17510.1 hypothetical protein [Thermoplasmatales archaeon]
MKDDIRFPTLLLIDSGADYSMLTKEIARDALNIDLSRLEREGKTTGIGGEMEVAWVNVKVGFGQRGVYFEEDISFQIPLEEEKDPPLPILGRDPFFYRYRIDFRMGYTKDSSLGKFVIYPEKHKRSPDKYLKPMKIKGKH